MQLSRKRITIISLVVLFCLIILLSVIYHQTALWKPEQSLITLLPESPLCYLTLKDLDDLVKTFNRSELGQQAATMPILTHIQNQLWWQQLVYQKLVWEHEMGGKLDMGAVKGHFGKEAILALYQREGVISFLLITELGGPEKLAIEALTATDAINPRYKRIQTKYNDLTINTIIGYPLDFSYTFIGKIGMLSLNPLLLAEVIDIYGGQKDGFLVQHLKESEIQSSYDNDKNTGYIDINQISAVLESLEIDFNLPFIQSILSSDRDYKHWTIGNRYEDGIIISQHSIGNTNNLKKNSSTKQRNISFLPEQTALVTYNPNFNWRKLWNRITGTSENVDDSNTLTFYNHLHPEFTLALITHNEDEVAKIPSVCIQIPIKDQDAFREELAKIQKLNISVAGKPLEFLEIQEYNGINVQPIRLRLHLFLTFLGGYAIIDNDFFFSSTLAGLRSILDTYNGDVPRTDDTYFTSYGIQTIIQPNLLVPEITRLIPILTILASMSGQNIDADLMQHLKDNLYPLESLGTITANVRSGENGVDAEIKIVLEE